MFHRMMLSRLRCVTSVVSTHIPQCQNYTHSFCNPERFFHISPISKLSEKACKIPVDVLKSFRSVVGDTNVTTSLATREQYGKDEGHYGNHPADCVIFAHSTLEVSNIAKLCYDHNIPMIPHGTGTGLENGVGAIQGGACIDLSQMTEVLDVHEEDLDVTVEPGVPWRELNHQLRSTGLMFTVDPGSEACIGGMAATGASGTNAVRYGTMKENVLNLEVVLADGTVIHTAGPQRRSRKSAAGYNLTNLFVGSEGTLGLITKVTLRLHAIPETTLSAVCAFKTVKNAVDSVIQTIQSSIPIARIEFLDECSMDIANQHNNLDYPVAPSLFLEFNGSMIEVESQKEVVESIISENGGSNFMWAKDTDTRNKLWKARHNLYYSTLAQKPGSLCITTDVCVPISHLAEIIVKTQEEIKKSGIFGTLLGHVGDGNFHCSLFYEPGNQAEFCIVKDLEEKIAMHALKLNGTCTGEHGIGVGKIHLLVEEFGDDGINVMRQIKKALDPKGLMNPGKIFNMTKC